MERPPAHPSPNETMLGIWKLMCIRLEGPPLARRFHTPPEQLSA